MNYGIKVFHELCREKNGEDCIFLQRDGALLRCGHADSEWGCFGNFLSSEDFNNQFKSENECKNFKKMINAAALIKKL